MFGEGDDRVVIGDVVAVVRRKLERAHDDIDGLADEAMVAERRVATAEHQVATAWRMAAEATAVAEGLRAERDAALLRIDEIEAERVAERADWDRLVRGLAQGNAALRVRLRAVAWAEAGRGRFLVLVGAAWLLWLRMRESRAVPVGRPTLRERERWAGGIALTYWALVVVAARLLGL